jgi:hypothetical protein
MAVVVVVVVIEYTHRASERAAFKNEANLTSKTLSKTRKREEKNTESENSTSALRTRIYDLTSCGGNSFSLSIYIRICVRGDAFPLYSFSRLLFDGLALAFSLLSVFWRRVIEWRSSSISAPLSSSPALFSRVFLC